MSAILSAFKDVDLRKKILFTIAMIILYRIGARRFRPQASTMRRLVGVCGS